MNKWLYISFILFYSCSSIQKSIILNKAVSISVQPYNNTLPVNNAFYNCTVIKNGDEYEFKVVQNNTEIIYKLPPNKLTLLYGMEEGFKDLTHNTKTNYYKVVVKKHTTKTVYKINTDLVGNFIKGLKKK